MRCERSNRLQQRRCSNFSKTESLIYDFFQLILYTLYTYKLWLIIIELENIYDFEILIHLVYSKLMVDMPDPVIDKSLIIDFIELFQCIFKIKKMTNVLKFLTSLPNHQGKMNLFRHG